MKKQPTKKLKTMIIKAPKVKPFDLSFKDTTENTKIIVALESLKGNAGWQFLTQVIQGNIDYLAERIITKMDGEVKLEEKDIDLLRDKHAYLKELLEKPDMFIKKLKSNPEVEENLDPYDS